jgi:hypothetical protein
MSGQYLYHSRFDDGCWGKYVSGVSHEELRERLYGVLAAVESSQEMDAAALAEGVCLARMHGDIFRLKVPRNFQPKDFSA